MLDEEEATRRRKAEKAKKRDRSSFESTSSSGGKSVQSVERRLSQSKGQANKKVAFSRSTNPTRSLLNVTDLESTTESRQRKKK